MRQTAIERSKNHARRRPENQGETGLKVYYVNHAASYWNRSQNSTNGPQDQPHNTRPTPANAAQPQDTPEGPAGIAGATEGPKPERMHTTAGRTTRGHAHGPQDIQQDSRQDSPTRCTPQAVTVSRTTPAGPGDQPRQAGPEAEPQQATRSPEQPDRHQKTAPSYRRPQKAPKPSRNARNAPQA